MRKIVVISPSGNLYGSERVLLDWLRKTELDLKVVVPQNSILHQTLLREQIVDEVKTFKNQKIAILYFRLFWNLLCNKYNVVYLNEGGHIRYINLLSRLFPNKKFVVHVRIVEDTVPNRRPNHQRKNLAVISISKFISQKLQVKSHLIYDLYPFSNKVFQNHLEERNPFRIGLIGRITKTKGLLILPKIQRSLQSIDPACNYVFSLYGEISPDILNDPGIMDELESSNIFKFEGFVSNNKEIFSGIDCVLHLSVQEPLGRVFLEAIDFNKPFVAIKAAGIGEIGEMLGLTELLVEPIENDLPYQLAQKIVLCRRNYLKFQDIISSIRVKAEKLFSPIEYTAKLDKLLSA